MIQWIIISVLFIWVCVLTMHVYSLRVSRDTNNKIMDNVWLWIAKHDTKKR